MIYTDKEKQIYTSPLKTQHDPIEVCNRLVVLSQGRWNVLCAAYFTPESELERAAAALELTKFARIVFGLKPLTEEGVGDGAVLEVVDHFMEYVSKKG